jgi:hypothetical protein
VLFVHGELDPLAPVAGPRRWAQVLPSASLAEFAGAKHDILNETAHAEVAAAISAWVLEVAAQPAARRVTGISPGVRPDLPPPGLCRVSGPASAVRPGR